MSLNLKLLVNITIENESCALNVCQLQSFSSVMNSSRSFTRWVQYDFFSYLASSFQPKEKKEKKILCEISDLSVYCRSLPSCFRQLAFCQLSCFSVPVWGQWPAVLKSPSAKPGGKLTRPYHFPLEPLLKKPSTEIDNSPPPFPRPT